MCDQYLDQKRQSIRQLKIYRCQVNDHCEQHNNNEKKTKKKTIIDVAVRRLFKDIPRAQHKSHTNYITLQCHCSVAVDQMKQFFLSFISFLFFRFVCSLKTGRFFFGDDFYFLFQIEIRSISVGRNIEIKSHRLHRGRR